MNPSRPIMAALASLLAAVTLSAQPPNVSFVAGSEMRAHASAFTWSETKTLPAQTDLTGGAQLVAGPSSNWSALVRVTLERSRSAIRATIVEAGLYPAGLPIGRAEAGPHDTVLTLSSPVPLRALLRLSATSTGYSHSNLSLWGYGARVAASDHTVDFVVDRGQTATVERLVVIDSGGLRLRTSTHGWAWAAISMQAAGFSGKLVIELVPDAVATPYGSSCGTPAPQLVALLRFDRQLELILSTGAPASFAKLLIGRLETNLRIPGTLCDLYTIPLVVLPHATDETGRAVHLLPLPPALLGPVYLQEIVVVPSGPGLELRATSGIKLEGR